ncbi:MAG: Ig-like domain-containing protein [Deltaproteobacteria bacterium]|nr:Ig-like domain-containing protein [Deltaproteobacteria bacterium]
MRCVGWVVTVLVIGLLAGQVGCGTGVDGETATGTTLVITTLERPAVATSSIVTKSASIQKAAEATDTAVGAGYKCRLTTWDGTELGTATSDANSQCIFAVDGDLLPNATLVVTSEELGIAKCEVLGACPGSSVDVGTTDPDSTVEAQLFLDTCGGSLEDTAGAASSAAKGGCVPQGVLATVRQMIGTTGTAGTANAEGAILALREAFRSALAEGRFSSGNAYRDLHLITHGDGGALTQWSAVSGVAIDQAIMQAKEGAAAINELLRDTEAFATFKQKGSAAWGALATYVGNLDATGNKKVRASPAVALSVLKEAIAEQGGDAGAFLKKSSAALALAEATGEEDCKQSDSKVLYKLLKSAAWEGVAADGVATHLKGICSTIAKAKDNPAQLAYLKDKSSEIVQAVFARPEAFASGSESTIRNILNVGVLGGSLGSATVLCTASTDCAGGSVCSPQNLCVSMDVSGSGRQLGALCTENSQCSSGLCRLDPATNHEFCSKAEGEATLTLKAYGETCKGNLECLSYVCTNGSCSSAAPPPEAALAVLLAESCPTDTTTGDTGADGRAVTTVDTTAPTVVLTGQADGAKGVAVNAVVTVTFSEEMDGTTITADTFRVTSDGAAINGTIAYKDRVATFTPNQSLNYFTTYTVTLTTGVKDAVGNAMASVVSFSFRTETAPPAAIAGGGGHTVVAATDGTVWTWGFNSNGQLGDGATTDRNTPVRVSNLGSVQSVGAGNLFSLAVRSDGTVWSWGANNTNQLGDGTTTDRTTPVQVSNLASITAVAAGLNHALALLSDGTIRAWGFNGNGRLGDGTTTDRATSIQVSSLTNITAIECGGSHSLALRNDGTVWAWGLNASGQLGDGSITQRTTPVQVSNLTGAIAIAAGLNNSVALKSDGTVWAWGTNTNNQLGDGTATQRTTPVQVSGLTGVTAIAVGDNFGLAYKADGTVWGWGYNSSGQLGDGTRTNRAIPVRSASVPAVTNIIAGGSHALAIKTDRSIIAWGYNFYGQLGDGSATYAAYRPNAVRNLSAVTTMATGGRHSLARTSDGKVWTWGVNQNGQLGNGTTTDHSVPASVSSLTGIIDVAAGGKFSVALKNDGTVWVWGINSSQELGIGAAGADVTTPLSVGGNFTGGTAIAAAEFSAYAIKGGALWAWGSNSNGQLGNGGLTNPGIPAQVNTVANVIAVAGGNRHALALQGDGTVWAWGLNGNGQLGDNSTTQRTAPVQVSGLTNVIGIAAGARHSIAVKNDGTVWAWGQNTSGQLGDGTTTQRTTPVQVSGLTGAIAVAAGPSWSMAVKGDGTVWAWGSNALAQLGDGTAVSTGKRTPIQTSPLTTATRLSAGPANNLSLARTTDGAVWEWGWNQATALSDGTSPYVLTPATVRWP